jgi:hypothetical protein
VQGKIALSGKVAEHGGNSNGDLNLQDPAIKHLEENQR